MTATDSCRPGILERPACFEIVPMATRSRRQPTNPHRPQPRRPASPRTGNCDGALTRAYGEIVHRPGFWPGRAWSDLLFTMSDNTHRSEPHGRTHQANASVRIDAFGRAAPPPMQRRERRRRRSAHTLTRCDQSFDAATLQRGRSDQNGRRSGGARRDRTDDLLLAKQALSQLSYGPVRNQRSPSHHGDRLPISENWWAWEDLNFRPHAYQARALTS